MQQEQIILPSGNTVRSPSGNHYVIEKLLGKGGFGAVYLVKDRQDEQKLYALKEVIDPSEQDRQRFSSEAQLLKHLQHEALPQVYDIFEQEKLRRVYILMDYVKGRNLETLLTEQPERCFSLPLTIAIMDSIVSALIYLHQQVPPVVHRDIKPANIIVPLNAEEAVLVDFGLAKEYVAGKTTMMIRHGSPGYAALEQYGHGGTTPRTDVYGLGATLYTMLTGVVPTDPVTRVTESQEFDSLTPASLLNPTVPTAVAKAIQRSMSISERERFASVAEFWQEITAHATDLHNGQQIITREAVKTPLRLPRPLTVTEQELSPITPLPAGPPRSFSKRTMLFSLLAILALAAWLVGTAVVFTALGHTSTPAPSLSYPKITLTHQPLFATPITPAQYPLLAQIYGGTIGDIVAKESTPMFLTNLQQKQGSICNYFVAHSCS